MPVLADFELIVGDGPVSIGDGRPLWETTFSTGGRHDTTAILLFNIRGLTHASRSAVVKVNNREVGRLYPYTGEFETARNWYTQMVALGPTQLRSGTNEIQIEAVRLDPPDTSGGNVFDDFEIKDVVIFFHQRA